MAVTTEEVRNAQKELDHAKQMIDYAEPEFLDSAFLLYDAKLERYQALIRICKKETKR